MVGVCVVSQDVPRYWRIATANANFVKFVRKLDGHAAVFESIGFAPSGAAATAATWRWDEGWKARPAFAAAVLGAAAAALEELKMNPSAGYDGGDAE